ncbi:MAG: hypothetical protein MJA30_15705 [Cytophagales bacterium]|nr:hypothetical protein [Cytophagales bacterium]
MNLEVPIDQLEKLLDELCKKLQVSRDKGGFMTIASKIKGLTNRYVRDNMHGNVIKAKKEGWESINLSLNKLDEISKFLGYTGFVAFQDSFKVNPHLAYFEGTYYSFIRKNSSTTEILQSPVKIEPEGAGMYLTLRGVDRQFRGEIELMEGCISCLMKSMDKAFYHVYKVGKVIKPKLIQGIFSGVSSAFDPIGGRCILVRQKLAFEALKNRKLIMEDADRTGDHELKELWTYFSTQEGNNLKINSPVGFDWGDLLN